MNTKITALLLTLSMAFAFAACGKVPEKNEKETRKKHTEVTEQAEEPGETKTIEMTEEPTNGKEPRETITIDNMTEETTKGEVPEMSFEEVDLTAEEIDADDVKLAIYPFELDIPVGCTDNRHMTSLVIQETNAADMGVISSAEMKFFVEENLGLDLKCKSTVMILEIEPDSELARLKAGDTFIIHNYMIEYLSPSFADTEWTVTAVNKNFILCIVDQYESDEVNYLPPFSIEQDQIAYDRFISLS